MTFALIGNQNCGKTTLFNQLTGSNQHVGNFPGVTVDKKEGTIKNSGGAVVVDLPGIYSISPYTMEEIVTRDYLLGGEPDGIINIVDATNIERNLYLTLQLLELEMPMVVALNMMDEVAGSGGSIDIQKISAGLGVPVVPISASKNEGVAELVTVALRTVQNNERPKHHDFCKGEVHRAIHSLAHMIEDHAEEKKIPLRFAATKLVEGDEAMMDKLEINQNEREIVQHVADEMEAALGTDREAALADMRYSYIEQICAGAVHKPGDTAEQLRSVQIDRILTHKVFSIPIFLGIMLLVFWLTFGVVGSTLSDLFAAGISLVTNLADEALTRLDVAPMLHALIIDGIFAGVGSVLGFMPTIVTLFFFLSILEDSGYMARVAFVMDKLLRKIGLSGRSFVPMVIGFGCSVPAIMASRTLSSERDRKMTILLTPFMSCSAKLPIYSVFTAAFFPEHGALVMMALYVTGMVVAILVGLLLKGTIFKGNPIPFVMELPAYRLPSAQNVLRHMWEKAKDFVVKAFTIIFVATIIVWVLQNFSTHLSIVTDSSDSILAAIGQVIAPVFAPLGFGDWRAATALITGLMAKETVVSTLAVLMNVGEPAMLVPVLSQLFTPLAAVSFLVFTLLYMPCVAAMAAVRRELGSLRGAAAAMAFQTSVAWVAAFLVYQVGMLLGF
ncbi:ferrous iron transport protein B [Hydrogenoanaerobacterium saccharovorans]|uniref:Ferrous iron transport protein B n=1 Tax=Hydrogenoanaerobacterium saccharovorans TaxID=474960 RepID=A0ABS2GIT9_9FIRM|nr:ferrous iron transport protein B [Hydrogenoanaerobacterium saccharovorans]MBM6922392.1 ferrous iron transport protein B [Hydrogenoanaerobacterium saccharovorans]